jgi:hypothetical protein
MFCCGSWENGMALSLWNTPSLYSCVAFAALCVAISSGTANAKATYTTFDDGRVEGINATDTVTGWAGGANSFVRTADGTDTTFTVQGAKTTMALSINDGNAVAGFYEDNADVKHGFVRAADGTIATFDGPKATATIANAINNKGDIAGLYVDDGGNAYGFVRTARGKLKTFSVPGAGETNASSINDKGAVAGDYFDGSGDHGFVRAPDGTITTIDVPGAVMTVATRINAKGTIAGWYADSDGVMHIFVRTSGGTITSFDDPGCDQIVPTGINTKGVVTGVCLTSQPQGHDYGFIVRSNGKFQSFQVPGGGTRTQPAGINDAGVIAGNYGRGGFLRFP